MQIVKWPSHVFRVFAIANFLLAGVGLLFLSSSVLAVGSGKIGNTSAHPYFLGAFWTMVATNFILLALLVLGGIRLLQLKAQGVVLCNGVFVAEIVYFIALGFLWGVPPPSLSVSVAAATGVGSMGLSPQLICGYPLVALVCLNLARPRLNATSQIVKPV
jgi:hypothetical protein